MIESKFTVLTYNNPLMYVRTSHLGAAQIHWLSDLALFDFDIRYLAGKSNQVADALSQWPINPESSSKSSDDEDEWETISYEMVCQIRDHHLDSTKIPFPVKYEVQSNTIDVETANVLVGLKLVSAINSQFAGVKLFGTSLPKQMAEYQKEDNQLSVIYEFVASNQKPKLSEIHRIRSKPIRHLLLQYDHLSLIWGILHHQTFQDNDEVQQLILPSILCGDILKSLHDDNGHQGLQHVLDVLGLQCMWMLTVGFQIVKSAP